MVMMAVLWVMGRADETTTGHFVRDVKRVAGEVHVLTPTRYEKPVEGNDKAARVNRNLVVGLGTGDAACERVGGDRDEDWEKRQENVVEALRMFGRARIIS